MRSLPPSGSRCSEDAMTWVQIVGTRADQVHFAPRPERCGRGAPVSFTRPLLSRRRQQALMVRWCPARLCAGNSSGNQPKKTRAKQTFSPPPSTFYQALNQAVEAVLAAVEAGERLLEIEFPPLPASVLNSTRSSSDDVIDANTRLAFDFAKMLQETTRERRNGRSTYQRVALIYPDMIERNRAFAGDAAPKKPGSGYANRFGDTVGTADSRIRLAALRAGYEAGNFIQRILQANIRDGDAGDRIEPILDDDDIFIVLGASAQELVDVEKFVQRLEETDKTRGDQRPVILFNMQLDTSRGDLGLPAFPSRMLHHRFLCRFLPVYYLRTRSYSRSISRPPFVVNYQGAIFRVYPEPYQVLLETQENRYRQVAQYATRPRLTEAKDALTKAVFPQQNEKNGGSFGFLRRGMQTATWWERASDDSSVSNKWRQ
jgi:hypothetical protein